MRLLIVGVVALIVTLTILTNAPLATSAVLPLFAIRL